MSWEEVLILGLAFVGAVYFLYRTLKPGGCGCGKGDCPAKKEL